MSRELQIQRAVALKAAVEVWKSTPVQIEEVEKRVLRTANKFLKWLSEWDTTINAITEKNTTKKQ